MDRSEYAGAMIKFPCIEYAICNYSHLFDKAAKYTAKRVEYQRHSLQFELFALCKSHSSHARHNASKDLMESFRTRIDGMDY